MSPVIVVCFLHRICG